MNLSRILKILVPDQMCAYGEAGGAQYRAYLEVLVNTTNISRFFSREDGD